MQSVERKTVAEATNLILGAMNRGKEKRQEAALEEKRKTEAAPPKGQGDAPKGEGDATPQKEKNGRS